MGGKKPLRRPLWPPTRATASNYYPLGLDGAGGAAKPLLRAPKKPAPLHGRLPAFSGAVDAFERARKCFLEWRYFFSIILSEFLKNRVALHGQQIVFIMHFNPNRNFKRQQKSPSQRTFYANWGTQSYFMGKTISKTRVLHITAALPGQTALLQPPQPPGGQRPPVCPQPSPAPKRPPADAGSPRSSDTMPGGPPRSLHR